MGTNSVAGLLSPMSCDLYVQTELFFREILFYLILSHTDISKVHFSRIRIFSNSV